MNASSWNADCSDLCKGSIMMHRSAIFSLMIAGLFGFAACAGSGSDGGGDDGAESEIVSAPPGSVEAASAKACSTLAVKGLAKQLVDEINCARPNVLTSLEGAEGIELDVETFPFVQTPLVQPLKDAAKSAKTTIKINSALRTLPQQVLLNQWAARKRCGITMAAKPGGSNHESGAAVDVANHAALHSTLTKKGSCASKESPQRACFQWMGSGDPVHYDFKGDGVEDLAGESIRAFQRLWNRNNPKQPLTENGTYDKDTEARVKASPADGFPKGAECAASPPADAAQTPPQAAETTSAPQQ
jgi:hypothetical protein